MLRRSSSTQVAVPADQHGGETDEAVQQRDQLGHAGHLDHPGAPEADHGADQHRRRSAGRRASGVHVVARRATAIVATSAIAMPTMPKGVAPLAVSCLDRPARARMKSSAATM